MSPVRAVAWPIAFAFVGYVAAVGITLRWLADAIDAAVRIDGGLHR